MKTLSMNFHLLNGYRGVYIGTGASIDLSSAQFDMLIRLESGKLTDAPDDGSSVNFLEN